jgi:SAM-dependent methyltransferase
MSHQNNQTLDVYAKHADLYEQKALSDFSNNSPKSQKFKKCYQRFLEESIKNISKDKKLFEIGSGYGRDANFIRSLGYNIQVSDAVDSFINRLRQEDFVPVKFNLITDDFKEMYDYILANAVLVHFPKDEVERAIIKIYEALNDDGIFAFSIKQRVGGGEDYKTNIASMKCYFSYWDIGEIQKTIDKIGFTLISADKVGGVRACWTNIIAKK